MGSPIRFPISPQNTQSPTNGRSRTIPNFDGIEGAVAAQAAPGVYVVFPDSRSGTVSRIFCSLQCLLSRKTRIQKSPVFFLAAQPLHTLTRAASSPS